MPPFTPERILPVLDAFPGARRCWLALSGGMDSLVLLHALAILGARLPCDLRAAHVDHGLHPDSRHWAERCRRACEPLGVPLRVLRVDAAPLAGESPEAAAREARYRALAGLMGPGDLLLTAQHRDDQAETLLLALLRGSGVKGLAAMPAAAPFGPGHLLRPLLGFGRAELRVYAETHGLVWVEDPSNADHSRDRNFLRHRVLPLLAERWPACAVTLSRSAAHCAEAQGLVDAAAAQALARGRGSRPGTLSIRALATMEPALARALLRHWIAEQGFRAPDAPRLARIQAEVIPARADAAPLVAWAGCEVRRYRDDLYAVEPLPPRPPADPIPWRGAELDLPLALGRLSWRDGKGRVVRPDAPGADGFTVRFGTAGVRCRPAGSAHHRSLKNLFQEAAAPTWLRPYVPLVFAGETLVAVAGLVLCGERDGPRPRWDGHPWVGTAVFGSMS